MERREVFQFKQTMSIPREKFIQKIVCNGRLTYDDTRVCLLLLTELDGWDMSRVTERSSIRDPYNFRPIDIKSIAEQLHMKKKEVKESIKILESEDILENGESSSSMNGYRFMF